MDVFWNTWSVEGFISEGLQPSELGWGTHETWRPKNAKKHKQRLQGGDLPRATGRQHESSDLVPDTGAAIRLSWSPTTNQSRSLTFFTVYSKKGKVKYRPTCHYAYHPANDAVLVPARNVRKWWQGTVTTACARRE
jgi:homospermidine synthase